MQDNEHVRFSSNELVAIHSALEAQIEDCHDLIANYDLSLPEKIQINKAIQYSESALERLNAVFEKRNFNPHKN